MADYNKTYEKKMKDVYNLLKPTYTDTSAYKTDETDERLEKTVPMPVFRDDSIPPERRVVKEVIVKRRAIPSDAESPLIPLRRVKPQIIGSLFDRVIFLEQRIEELRNSLEIRERLHKEISESIDADIREKENMIIGVSDVDEKRNLKLDISLLMKEKRRESIEFWRDTCTLRGELRELIEEHKTEKKIASIFGNPEEKAK